MVELGYTFVIEKTENNFSAYVSEFDGCVATGKTRKEVEKNILEALKFHIAGLQEDGIDIPAPKSSIPVFYVEELEKFRTKGYLSQ